MSEKVSEFFANYGPVLLKFAITLVVGIVLINIVRAIVKRSLKRTKIDASAHSFIAKAIVIVLYFVLLVVCVDMLGVPAATFVALLSAVGLAFSLAMQKSLTNLVSGVMMLFTRPFKKGDYVEVASTEGRVDNIGFTYTQLLTYDNKVILIPNTDVVNAKIIDYSVSEKRRLDLPVEIAYNDDIETARRVILATAKQTGMLVDAEKSFVSVDEYKPAAVVLIARVWAKNEDFGAFKAKLMEDLLPAFKAAGIGLSGNALGANKE